MTGFESSAGAHFVFLYISTLSRLPFSLSLCSPISPRFYFRLLSPTHANRVSSLSSLLSASSQNHKFSRLKSWSMRDHDHDHNHHHRPLPFPWCVPQVERGNAACTGFVRPCLPVWRHIYEVPSIQSQYSVQLSSSLSTWTARLSRVISARRKLSGTFTTSFSRVIPHASFPLLIS